MRNFSRNERLYPRFAAFLTDFLRQHKIEVAHGQHYLTIPPTVQAARLVGCASVATVRDYWPVCYWTTQLNGDRVCPGCSELNRLKCLVGNQGVVGAVAAPVSLYMGSNLRLKQRWLAQADRTLAVSHYVADKLRPFVPADRLTVVPNFVDLTRLDEITAQPPATPATRQPYLLFAGKFEENKGVRLLLDVLQQARPTLPTLAVGWGALQGDLERAALQENLNLQIIGRVENAEVLRLMKGAEALLFPSLWPEPLSRVLLEAVGVGSLIVAMNTGGTPDIIEDNLTGLLATDAPTMARRLTDILQPDRADQRTALRQAARQYAQSHFSQEAVIEQVEEVYRTVVSDRTTRRL